jgi:hypothetical protein
MYLGITVISILLGIALLWPYLAKNKNLVCSGFSLLLLLAAVTNPPYEIHKLKIKQEAFKQMNRSAGLNSGNNFQKAGYSLGSTLGIAVIDKMLDVLVNADSYLFFSLTRINYQGESKIIGIGAFGNVFLFINSNSLARFN